MKLREDLKKKQGAAFSLEEFHNNFLKQGFPPIRSFAKRCWAITRRPMTDVIYVSG